MAKWNEAGCVVEKGQDEERQALLSPSRSYHSVLRLLEQRSRIIEPDQQDQRAYLHSGVYYLMYLLALANGYTAWSVGADLGEWASGDVLALTDIFKYFFAGVAAVADWVLALRYSMRGVDFLFKERFNVKAWIAALVTSFAFAGLTHRAALIAGDDSISGMIMIPAYLLRVPIIYFSAFAFKGAMSMPSARDCSERIDLLWRLARMQEKILSAEETEVQQIYASCFLPQGNMLAIVNRLLHDSLKEDDLREEKKPDVVDRKAAWLEKMRSGVSTAIGIFGPAPLLIPPVRALVRDGLVDLGAPEDGWGAEAVADTVAVACVGTVSLLWSYAMRKLSRGWDDQTRFQLKVPQDKFKPVRHLATAVPVAAYGKEMLDSVSGVLKYPGGVVAIVATISLFHDALGKEPVETTQDHRMAVYILTRKLWEAVRQLPQAEVKDLHCAASQLYRSRFG
ncbi:MAG: hypothetical protein A3C55_04290 [Gammaproteobacteria bacterium RIFCSPHIGHO2_02_FULL_42_13]|nr:MAG: hypothetical protein A3C55_04290 [Gammaproteobacteria bacterium RIFCSPHIGHO2_02_FULL_42_13]OGT69658.1 MAG: hypothetical protein A3H43_05245 [Gammaproteobacteria bacterium RIFCSPLOWO2_02_FULL_42_9]